MTIKHLAAFAASAALIAGALHRGTLTIGSIKGRLADAGLAVRRVGVP